MDGGQEDRAASIIMTKPEIIAEFGVREGSLPIVEILSPCFASDLEQEGKYCKVRAEDSFRKNEEMRLQMEIKELEYRMTILKRQLFRVTSGWYKKNLIRLSDHIEEFLQRNRIEWDTDPRILNPNNWIDVKHDQQEM
jgi:hypothetical protein